jgi:ATP synthase subunit 6
MRFSPLEQFEIFNLFPLIETGSTPFWLYILKFGTTRSIFMLTNFFITLNILLFLVIVIHLVFFLKNKIITLNWKFLYYFFLIIGYQLIRDLIVNISGKVNYFSLLLFIFITISLLNVLGLIPYIFVLTSQFVFTFMLSSWYFISLNLTGLYYHGLNLLNLFFPSGTPLSIIPLLILIEIISYIARMFSLAIRLFANITAGHILLKILSWFTYLLVDIFFVSLLGFILITTLWGLEFFISLLQAYVFLILLCIYLNDVLNLH